MFSEFIQLFWNGLSFSKSNKHALFCQNEWICSVIRVISVSYILEWHNICLSNRHQWAMRCRARRRLPRHVEYQQFRSRVHQLELHVSERKEVHGTESGRQQSWTGKSQLLQVCEQSNVFSGGACEGINTRSDSPWKHLTDGALDTWAMVSHHLASPMPAAILTQFGCSCRRANDMGTSIFWLWQEVIL